MRKSMHEMEYSFTVPWPSLAIAVGRFYRSGRESDRRFGAPDYRAERAGRDTQIIRFWPSSPTR
jgi:hypothetical protein